MRPSRIRLLWLATLLVTGIVPPSHALDWERMVMPGPLASAHEEFEKDCRSCHAAFDVDQQRTLCLVCHEEIAADLDRQEGFHSLNALAATGQCRSCHPDHKGRDANILGLSEATFDHAQTDYPLRGRHEAAACGDCHKPDLPRREAPSACIACHRDDDAHDGALSEDCGQCHDERAWRTNRFDHDETNYPLTGAHEKASCGGCHVSDQYKDTPRDCVSCHAIDDAHDGRFGSDCADCHTTAGWQKDEFDHFKESGFALEGAHANATCATCHRQPPGQRKLPENCSGCHKQEDVHGGRFGSDCGTCHRPSSWAKTAFDHGKATDFPLNGAHARSSCNGCHTQAVGPDVEMASDCYTCHRADDVHNGELGKQCAECHNEESFSGRVLFEHDLTGFPLLGLHAAASCESCHSDHSFKETDTDCRVCHAADDVHEKTLGEDCGRCHNPNGWSLWQFDHDVDTGFALHGAHTGLECGACHRSAMTERTQMGDDCVDCHASDDAHRGGFGRRCGDCHSEQKWKPATFGRSSRPRGDRR